MESLPEKLSDREQEILECLVDGYSDQRIAEALYLSLNTVKWYNRRIYAKLGIGSRTQAIARARELRLAGAPAASEAAAHPPQVRQAEASADRLAPRLLAELNAFIGRTREVTEIERLLEENRLLTLVGPPGAGKTRLALQVARKAGAFAGGACFVPLAPVAAPENILWAIGDRLDLQFDGQAAPLRQLLAYLRERSLLFVLDNFDHLLPGRGLLTEMLREAPGIKIIVTSRERLWLYGEALYPVGGMELPPVDDGASAEASEAVQLFIERARSTAPAGAWQAGDMKHILRICRLVEGSPLGIELAATWVDTLRPQEIAVEIERDIDILAVERRDLPPERRSIRAAFERSWNLLDAAQAAAFRRLAVFRGGLTRSAGEAVAGIGLRTLQGLVAKSLLRYNAETGRYEIHELLRHYAAEQLELAGEAEAVKRAHAAYFAGFIAERWPQMKDQRQQAALDAIRADFENARLAWLYWVERRDASQLMRFLHGFWALFDIQGRPALGIELFEAAVQVLQSDPSPAAQACVGWLLAAQGLFSVPVEDYEPQSGGAPQPMWLAAHGLYNAIGAGPERGYRLARRGIEILQRLEGYRELLVVPLISASVIASQMPGEAPAARQAAQECLQLTTEIGDRWAMARASQLLAVCAIEDGDFIAAERLAGEALATFEAAGDRWSASVVCIEVLGLLAIGQQQYDRANEFINRGLDAAAAIDFKYSIQTAYWQLGYVAALQEDYAAAGAAWRKALAVSEHMLGGRGFIGFGSRRRSREWGGPPAAAHLRR